MKKKILSLVFLFSISFIYADEGMWMMTQIDDALLNKMQEKGCNLSANEIYDTKKESLKDAIIIFGNGCTGVVVSEQGLIFTNHHCGYAAIQQVSTVENNYLRDGFTAKELSDEIPVEGLTVTFLESIEDVSNRVLDAIADISDYKARTEAQDSVIQAIKDEYEDNENLYVRSFYSENEFYLLQYKVFKDIRLAYTPPSSIGKFGGDTDNWMWSRHTGDFSVFRIYADSLNQASEYSENNLPYQTKKVVPISLKGYQEGDYAMIMGYPGSTSRYITSYGLHTRLRAINQARIDVRGEKQAVWKSFMEKDEAINLAYANKYAGSSNYWKNSIGMNQAVEKLQVIEQKVTEEQALKQWIDADAERQAIYGDVLALLSRNYQVSFANMHALSYLTEALAIGVALPRIASQLQSNILMELSTDSILGIAEESYKNYYPEVEEATFAVMLKTYRKYVDKAFLPDFYHEIDKKFKGNYEVYAAYIFKKSAFSDLNKFTNHLKKNKIKLKKDPALLIFNQVEHQLDMLNSSEYLAQLDSIQHATRQLEAALREFYAEQNLPHYPDANFTMRMTYGTIGGYQPGDAVDYRYYSTTQGIIEKEIPNDMEFHVPEKLKNLILQKEFGQYADAETHELFVNFLSNNDITGGNSGSPVFNADGELLGLAFDGNWEAMSGDIVFEHKLQRCINVDVRYMLFIMDKIGGAESLLKELNIISSE